jgi:hypothetical protein
MMEIKNITVILVFLFIGSSWGAPQINDKCRAEKKNIVINNEDINRLNIDLKKIKNRKQFLKNWFLKKYLKSTEKMSIAEIRNDKYSISVYKLILSNDSPTSLNKKYSIVYFEKSNMSFLIPIEFNKIIQLDKEQMIGGYKESREYEFYYIYVLKLKTLKLVMDTSKDCDYGVKVGYFRNDECFEYVPNRFNCEIYNNNNEIRFVGKIKNYCKPNIDRDENNLIPLEIINSQIIYKYSKSKWIFQKESNYKCW